MCVLAIKTQSNLRLVQKLLDAMQCALERGYYEHVGSQQLWKTHCTTVNKLQSRLHSLDIVEVSVCHWHSPLCDLSRLTEK